MDKKTDGWERPDSVPYPSVWCRFQGRREIDGVIPKFWIQDIPEDLYETVIDYMVGQFVNDEPICLYSKISSDPVSMTEIREMWRGLLKDKLGLICYMENPDPKGEPTIAAMNCTHVKCKSEKFFKPEGTSMSIIMDTVNFLSKMKDEFEALQLDVLLNAMGLYVLPKFRGQGLGLELLKAREPLCKAVGIKATVTLFTATASQILAARAGFQELSIISYAELEKLNPKLRYPGIEEHSKCLKYMYKVY